MFILNSRLSIWVSITSPTRKNLWANLCQRALRSEAAPWILPFNQKRGSLPSSWKPTLLLRMRFSTIIKITQKIIWFILWAITRFCNSQKMSLKIVKSVRSLPCNISRAQRFFSFKTIIWFTTKRFSQNMTKLRRKRVDRWSTKRPHQLMWILIYRLKKWRFLQIWMILSLTKHIPGKR